MLQELNVFGCDALESIAGIQNGHSAGRYFGIIEIGVIGDQDDQVIFLEVSE